MAAAKNWPKSEIARKRKSKRGTQGVFDQRVAALRASRQRPQ
jgi:hypothetical protein